VETNASLDNPHHYLHRSSIHEFQHQSLLQCYWRHFKGVWCERASCEMRCHDLSRCIVSSTCSANSATHTDLSRSAFGCELWAPWSEELGRKPILQASLFLVNIWQLPVALAPNFGCLLAGRFLGGLSSAGGSVTLGMIADMWDSEHQQYAVAYVVFSSVGGSALGPIVGGFVERVSNLIPTNVLIKD
jgi:hypothetical protein